MWSSFTGYGCGRVLRVANARCWSVDDNNWLNLAVYAYNRLLSRKSPFMRSKSDWCRMAQLDQHFHPCYSYKILLAQTLLHLKNTLVLMKFSKADVTSMCKIPMLLYALGVHLSGQPAYGCQVKLVCCAAVHALYPLIPIIIYQFSFQITGVKV